MPGAARDRVGRRAVETAERELDVRGREHGLAALVGGLSRRRRLARVRKLALTHNDVKTFATRSTSSSVVVVANGSASARSNARSAPGKSP